LRLPFAETGINNKYLTLKFKRMKTFLMVCLLAGVFTACNNASDSTANMKDSLDSVATEQKDMIDSTAEQKEERVDSITEEKKDALDRKDSMNRENQKDTSK
jgi:hypothetical protein